MPIPHQPGTIWNAELHGVVIPTSHESSVLYRFEAAAWARFCETHGIPTGKPVSVEVANLARRAHMLRAPYAGPNPLAQFAAVMACQAEVAALIVQARALLATEATERRAA